MLIDPRINPQTGQEQVITMQAGPGMPPVIYKLVASHLFTDQAIAQLKAILVPAIVDAVIERLKTEEA